MTLSQRKTFLDFFPVPEYLLLSTTGIAISENDTKFVQLSKGIFGNGFELVHASKVANPAGAFESGTIVKSDEIVPILKKLAEHYGIRYARAVLPEEKAYLFTTSIQRVPYEGLRDAVAFILEENVPISIAESVFDFDIINKDENTGEIKIAVTVLPKSLVNTYVELFESAGITPISFELESQATSRTVIHFQDRRPQLVINLSEKKTGFYVVENGVVQFTTTPAYGVSADGAYSNIADLQAEMRKVLAFWKVGNQDADKPVKKIEKAVLCGAGAGHIEFVKKLMEESELEYSLADVWLNISSARKHVPEIPFEESLDYASAIGLILSGGR